MKTISAKRRSEPFLVISRDEIIDLLLSRISRICTGIKDPKYRVNFTAGFDTTAPLNSYQVNTSNHEFFGGASPNYFIPVGGLSKDHIFERLKACNKGIHVPMATEVTVVVFSFQNTPKGMPPSFSPSDHPQTTNKQNQFALVVVEVCEMDAMKD